MDTDSNQVRLSAVGIICLAAFAALFVRLWFLQGIDRQEFQIASQSNRLRVIHEEASRGRVLDRQGRIIVDNRTSLVVFLDREPLRGLTADQRGELFARVAGELTDRFRIPVKASKIEARYNDGRWSPQELVPIVSDVPEEVDLYFSERRDRFPGVVVDRRAVRAYPYGRLAAHLLGYVGEINEGELAERQKVDGTPDGSAPPEVDDNGRKRPSKPYDKGDTIGKGGVEAAYESDLRGIPGKRVIEVNARGEYVSDVSYTPPERGEDVWLNIDLDIQAQAERQLEEKILSVRGQRKDGVVMRAPEGAAVLADPRSGAVLAMASYPNYDPAELVNGIPSDLWTRLNSDDEGRPFFNRVTQGAFPPASTFKLFGSYAAWQSGLLNPSNERFFDRGTFRLQNCRGAKCEFRNAGGAANGTVDLPRAITVSSDTYYYNLAEQFWLRRNEYGEAPIQDGAARFGIGSKTGIDLPGETSGSLPTPEKRRKAYEARPDLFVTGDWRTGDNLNTIIGQGDVLVSPLQLNTAYGAFAFGGRRFAPRIVKQVTRPVDPSKPPGEQGNFTVQRTIEPTEVEAVPFRDPGGYQRLWSGFAGVVGPGGTAKAPYEANRPAWPVAGKTGTAENKVPAGKPPKADSSLFVGWAPASAGSSPEYVITVVIPEAGFGSESAAPVAFRVLKPISEASTPPACPTAQQAACNAALEAARAQAVADRAMGGVD